MLSWWQTLKPETGFEKKTAGLRALYTMSGKKGPTVFSRNFDKFRQLFIIFGMNHPDNPCD